MATLNKKQVDFLTDYVMMTIEEDLETKIKALRETDEWKNAIEEGKSDETVLKEIEKYKESLEYEQKMYELQEELKDKNRIICYRYDSGTFETCYYNKIDNPEEKIEEEIDWRIRRYALDKTGFFEHLSRLWNERSNIRKEVSGRLSVMNEGDFDEIVDSLVTKFNTQEIIDKVVAKEKK